MDAALAKLTWVVIATIASVIFAAGGLVVMVRRNGRDIEKIEGDCGVCRNDVHGRIDKVLDGLGDVKEDVAEIRGLLTRWMRENGRK